MMTSSNGSIFRVTGHLCGEFTGRRWIPRAKVSDGELWCFLCTWINGWVSNAEAGDLRCPRDHYDFTVMLIAVKYECFALTGPGDDALELLTFSSYKKLQELLKCITDLSDHYTHKTVLCKGITLIDIVYDICHWIVPEHFHVSPGGSVFWYPCPFLASEVH